MSELDEMTGFLNDPDGYSFKKNDKLDKDMDSFLNEEVKPDTGSGLIGDVIIGVGEGVFRTPSTITGALDIVPGLMGYDKPVGKAFNKLGEMTGFQPEKLADEVKYSPKLEKQQKELDRLWDESSIKDIDLSKGGTWDNLSEKDTAVFEHLAKNPALATNFISKSSVPMLAGGWLGKILKGMGVVGGAYLGEGTIMAGDAMSQMDESVSPQKRALTSLGIGAIGSGVGALGSKVAQKAGVIDPEMLIAKGYTRKQAQEIAEQSQRGLIGRTSVGGTIEAGEEGLQTTAETGLQNLAEGKDFGEGLGRNIVEGSIAGAAMGAGGNIPGPILKPKGALSRAVDKAPPPQQPNEQAPLQDDIVQPTEQADAHVRKNERRQDALRKTIDDMSETEKVNTIDELRTHGEEIQKKLYTSEVSGIPNKQAYDDAPKKKYVGFIDMDGLKWENDNMGHLSADASLKKMGGALAESKLDSYHMSGDEYIVQADTKEEIQSELKKVQESLRKEVRKGKNMEGDDVELPGIGFSFGIAEDVNSADKAMQGNKEERKKRGERSQNREDTPLGFVNKTFNNKVQKLIEDANGSIVQESLKEAVDKGEVKSNEDLLKWQDKLNEDRTKSITDGKSAGSIDTISGITDGGIEQATQHDTEATEPVGQSTEGVKNDDVTGEQTGSVGMDAGKLSEQQEGAGEVSDSPSNTLSKETTLIKGEKNAEEKTNKAQEQKTDEKRILDEQTSKAKTAQKGQEAKTQRANYVDPLKPKQSSKQYAVAKVKSEAGTLANYVRNQIKDRDLENNSENKAIFKTEYEQKLNDVDYKTDKLRAEASLTYEKFREISLESNPKESNDMTRLSYDALREDFGITDEVKNKLNELKKQDKQVQVSSDSKMDSPQSQREIVKGDSTAQDTPGKSDKRREVHTKLETKSVKDGDKSKAVKEDETTKEKLEDKEVVVKKSTAKQPTTKTTESDIQDWLSRRQKRMFATGKLNMVKSWEDLPAGLRERGEVLTSSDVNKLSGVEGLYDPKTDSTYLIQNMLDESNIHQVLNHELFHRARATDKKLQSNLEKIDKRFSQRFNVTSEGKGSQVEKDAYARVMKAKTKESDQVEEFQAYLISEYNKNPDSFVGSVKKIMQDLYAAIRAVLIRNGVLPKNITPADLNALAQYGTKVSQGKLSRETQQGTKTKDSADLLASIRPAGDLLSTQFKRWFGKSKMVSKGKPIKFYHGTNADFTVFDKKKLAQSKEGQDVIQSTAALGHFFVADKATADSYGDSTHEVYLSLQNPYVVNSNVLDSKIGDDSAKFAESLKAKGYDGIYVKDAKYVIAFESNQIKLTSNKTPSFGDDIRFSKKSFNIRPEQKETLTKAKVIVKKFMQRYFAPKGLMSDKVFDIKLESDFMKNVGEEEVQFLSYQLRKEALKAYDVKHYADLPKKVTQEINKELNGEKSNLPLKVKETVVTMRAMMDSLSGELQQSIIDNIELRKETMSDKQIENYDLWVDTDGEQGNAPEDIVNATVMLRTIENNKGNYVHRSYQAFDDQNWMDKALKNSDLISRAESFIAEQSPDLTSSQASAEVKGILQRAKDNGDMSAVISQGRKQGSKDMSIMKKRKNLDLIIRELLGEHKDPLVNFTKSTTKMQWFIANHYFLSNVRKNGIDVFLLKKRDTIDGVDYIQPIANKSNKSLSPLSGLFTSIDFNNALEDVIPNNNSSDLVNQYIKWNSAVKYGKTILSPTTQFRNFMSAGMFSIMSGHFNWSHGRQAMKVMRSDIFTHEEKYHKYIKDLISKGVLHDNPFAGELRDALNDFYEQQDFSSGTKKGVKAGFKRALEFAQKSYQAGDDFWKIIGYENELQQQLNNGLSQKDAETKAAYRIRNGYPTYSMVPKGMRWLRRFPLMGTFVSFPYEIVRTTVNNIGFIREDMKNDQASAAKRVVGMSIASSAAYAASQLSMILMGLSDEDDEAVKLMTPEWSRNSQFLYMGYDRNGLPKYLDLSSLDPYTYLKKPLSAILSGNNEGISDKLKDAVKEMLDPFLGIDIAAAKIFEVVSNKKESGGVVYNDQDTDDVKMGRVLNHLRKGLQPGVLSNVERMGKAVLGSKSRTGKEYKVSDELFALIGFRLSTANMKQSLIYKGYSFLDDKRNSQRILSRVAGSRENINDSQIKNAFNRSMKARKESYQEMIKLADSMNNFGISRQDIMRSLRGAGVTRGDVLSIMRGVVPKWKMSSQFIKSATSRALASSVTSSEIVKIRREMMIRRRLINKLGLKYKG